jgi:spore germination protein KA
MPVKQKVSAVLEENISTIQQIFGQDKTVKSHRFQPLAVGGLRCCIFFVDGMVDSIRINESMIQPINTLSAGPGDGADPAL